ncbi:hypothetical protein GUJ93_ZPchr0008g13901 [Zizania palustris]|uniref:Uncharacterized protein n=1 Tax=Zizania palustris TaxID=103762 RepID=A0A8J5RWY2_ZIZPA|nr:hypothetical protein GUJ93_ZPchr0008g13901 [Zizania palustris]
MPAAHIVTVVPYVGLACEVVVGSPMTPSEKRVYKATNRHAEGKIPVYAVVFNFLDVRYYDNEWELQRWFRINTMMTIR